MAGADLEAARTRLRVERDRLRAELEATVNAPDPMTYGSQAAAATQVFDQQRDLALRERAENQLAPGRGRPRTDREGHVRNMPAMR